MSRSGDQYLFEIAAAGKYFSAWVCDGQNLSFLVTAINKAALEYERQRTERVYMCGVPVAEVPSPLSAAATPATVTKAGKGKEVPRSSPPFAPDPEDKEAEGNQFLASVSDVAEKVSQAACSAASTALNLGRFFCAKALDSALSNSLEKFREMFPVVNKTNAQIAFLYIGQLSNGWAVEHHKGIGRASLSTLILTAVLDEFVRMETARTAKKNGKFYELIAGTSIEDAEKDDFVEVCSAPAREGDVVDSVDRDLPYLFKFLTCYELKDGIDPLKCPEQAKQIFLAFVRTDAATRLSIPLQNHITEQTKRLEAANKPSGPK